MKKLTTVLSLLVAAILMSGIYLATETTPEPNAAEPTPEVQQAEDLTSLQDPASATEVSSCSIPCATSNQCNPPGCISSLPEVEDLGVRCCNDGGQRFTCSGNQTVHVGTGDCGPQGGGPGVCPDGYSYKFCG